MNFDLVELQRVIDSDHALKEAEKAELKERLNDKDAVLKSLSFGATGAATALLVGKYLKLSKTTQVLLSLAGFGIGRALYNSLIKNPGRDNFGKVNKHNQYEINN